MSSNFPECQPNFRQIPAVKILIGFLGDLKTAKGPAHLDNSSFFYCFIGGSKGKIKKKTMASLGRDFEFFPLLKFCKGSENQ